VNNLPPDDRVKVTKIRRSKSQLGQAKFAELLVRQYDLLSTEEKHAAAIAARLVGEDYAQDHPHASVGFEHYLKVCVQDGLLLKVMNDVDYALWSFAPRDDARVLEFCRGFRDALAGPRKQKARHDATTKTLKQASEYLKNPLPAESDGHKRLETFIKAYVDRHDKPKKRKKRK
jgi:hypothetical protein